MLSSIALPLNLVPRIDVTSQHPQAISLVENCWSSAAEAPTAEDSPQSQPSSVTLLQKASYDLIDEGLSFKVPSEKWVCSLSSARNT
jgi:hypothetical protein